MNDRQFEQMLGLQSNESPLTSLMALLTASHMKYIRETTPEEREQRRLQIEASIREDKRQVTIHQGKCPTCEGKLIRGKKDKKMNYQRGWECKSCDEVHYI